MNSETLRINMYPLKDDAIQLNFGEYEYEILERIDELVKAKFINFHPNIESADIVHYTCPSIFFIDHGNHLILNEDKTPIAKTSLIRERNGN
ncbi:hypothetical protein [Acinetobacter venetianus]|uniref:hypothetical protein n=1 Tax=Acinetobacter venetianus TaxID=52133 RepID=UPI003F93F423